jgi:hypothetical protein
VLAAAQKIVEQDLANRTSQLGTLTTRVENAASITPGDQSTLETDLSDETSGIAALSQKVPSDQTCLQVRTDAHAMVYDYRVFYVMTPQVDLTISADGESAVEAKLAGYEPRIAQAIANATKEGHPTGPEQAAFTNYQAKVSAAQQATGGLSAEILAQAPAGAPGNRSVFFDAKAALANSRAQLAAAATDLRMIVAGLR